VKVYQIRTYENESAPFWEPHSPQSYRLVGNFTISLEKPSISAALEALYVVGNKMGADATGRRWPATRRSLSVGDLAVIGAAHYVCAMAGWRKTAIKHSLND
jgi:hypothetical protein